MYADHRISDDDGDGELDLSIVGDEEEQHRIELENNLQDISIQLSLTNPSQASEHTENLHGRHSETSYSLEYPRHDPNPHDGSIFLAHGPTFPTDQSHMHYELNSQLYSYRTAEDEDGINPYGGDTMSTAAHHASALTLRAGLVGKGATRTVGDDVSLSGAEYDPDRPLERVMNGIIKDTSMFSVASERVRPRRKRSPSRPQVTFDPVTCEAKEPGACSGHLHACQDFEENERRVSHIPPHSTNSDSTPGGRHSHHLDHRDPSPFSSSPFVSALASKPKQYPRKPALNVQPPTPSTGGSGSGSSKFTKMAKDIAKEIETSQRNTDASIRERGEKVTIRSTAKPVKLRKQLPERNPFQDLLNNLSISTQQATNPSNTTMLPPARHPRSKRLSASRIRTSDKVQLPDVTGLTSAVGSPAKQSLECWRYPNDYETGEIEEHVVQTLTKLQTRLNQLESENLVSRRRVRELELELESCKADVKRERTRVLEREEIIVAQQREVSKRSKGKGRVFYNDSLAVEKRYDEVVEEKKALEALIATLRSHLNRLTSELSSHQVMISELQELRDSDVQTMVGKISEVDRLKLEVERLGGEVQILRGVIEEGLKERRRVKHASKSTPSSLLEQGHCGDIPGDDGPANRSHHTVNRSGFSRQQSELHTEPHGVDKTIRTDRATDGSLRVDLGKAGRYVEDEEIDRVTEELEERRSERSQSTHRSVPSFHAEFQPPTSDRPSHRKGTVEVATLHTETARENGEAMDGPSPPPGPTPSHVHGLSTEGVHNDPPTTTPFPQIRGERLERLFFSAPAHNPNTCRACHRRMRPRAPILFPPLQGRQRRASEVGDDLDDEGYVEGSDADTGVRETERKYFGKFGGDKLPPQTVLARVLRELEDDFTHYKGIYIELADQYKLMDANSNVLKRNVLAEHLQEVISALEQRGDQIASLYDLLTYKDKPLSPTACGQ
ncbi:hypothetical protein BD410DRAFT_788773 [Rickenella mellea]|uniref:Cep57 centrosome microtubule-binding domain-containing protein n=1 Tax=Rickenella mellea TaxID=50990 RepID=A0A4Y7Q441_9AGAM|nr:hypothetical protein BD410DRAFT_788773 [Rickenella mellea]